MKPSAAVSSASTAGASASATRGPPTTMTTTHPFPDFALSPEDAAELGDVAQRFIDAGLDEYAAFRDRDRGIVDPTRWAPLRARDGVAVYADRRAPAPALPRLLGHGRLPGTLDDAMYGALNPTVGAMRVKSSYVRDGVVDCAVLARLRSPSPRAPFESLAVKWAVKGQALHVRTLVRNRDFVYLEATGTAVLAGTNELVGFQLVHSVDFPTTRVPHETSGHRRRHKTSSSSSSSLTNNKTKKKSALLRGHVSICGVWRQHTPTSVEMFVTGFLDPKGQVLRPFVIRSGVDVVLSVAHNIHYAQMKKLAWSIERPTPALARRRQQQEQLRRRLQEQHEQQQQQQRGSSQSQRRRSGRRSRRWLGHREPQEDENEDDVGNDNGGCDDDDKAPGLSGSVLADPTACLVCENPPCVGIVPAKRCCRLCLHRVCSACRITRHLHGLAPDGRTIRRERVLFCVACVSTVVHADALEIAVAEAALGSSTKLLPPL